MPDPSDPSLSDPYQRLLAEIGRGELRPGDRLKETDVANRFKISRTPVRDAIRALEADGLVVHVPRAGATIRTLSFAEITDLYEMRAILEGSAARFAARAAYDSEIEALVDLNAEMARSGSDARHRFDMNSRFHMILLNAARNQFLIRAVQSMQKTLLILGSSTLEDLDRVREAVTEHQQIIAAVKSHDGDAAEAAMRAHIETAHRARLKRLRGGQAG